MLAAILAVAVQLALPPEHQPYDERYRNAAASAVRLLEEWFGPLPGGDITLVAKSRRGPRAGDRVVVVNTRWPVTRYSRDLENDVVSALARRYWSRPAVQRTEDTRLMEGLVEYSRARMMENLFPEGAPTERRFFG